MSFSCPLHGKKIAFVTCGYPLDVSTMLINSLELLSENNTVHIVVSGDDVRHHLCPEWMRRLFVYSPVIRRDLFSRGVRKLLRITSCFVPQKFFKLSWVLKNINLYIFSLWFRKFVRKECCDVIIAVECHALIAVYFAGNANATLLYYNMELLDWADSNPLYDDKLALKQLEVAALNSVSRVLITSPNRAKIFSEINEYPLAKVFVLPVVPRSARSVARSSFFRDIFGISSDRRIAVYSGNFMPWALCLEIIQSMNDWPEDVVLIMHTWNAQAIGSEYFMRMQEAACGRPVYFSTEYLPYSELSSALSSADVGLLFYEAIDANFTEILFSSNKFGEYMSAGLPVICSDFPSLAGFVQSQGIGCPASIEQIGCALRRVFEDLEGYKRRVALCRDTHFNFDSYFEKAYSSFADDEGC